MSYDQIGELFMSLVLINNYTRSPVGPRVSSL